jgi:hypothetical protein
MTVPPSAGSLTTVSVAFGIQPALAGPAVCSANVTSNSTRAKNNPSTMALSSFFFVVFVFFPCRVLAC